MTNKAGVSENAVKRISFPLIWTIRVNISNMLICEKWAKAWVYPMSTQ